MPSKFKSRKFWIAMIGQITAMLVLLFPAHAQGIEAAATNIGALLLMALSGWGFISGESAIDRESVAQQTRLKAVEKHIAHSKEMAKSNQDKPGVTGSSAALILLVSVLLIGGCAADGVPVYPTQTYVDTVGERWLQYVQDDPALSVVEKETYRTFHADYKALVDDVASGGTGPIFPLPIPEE